MKSIRRPLLPLLILPFLFLLACVAPGLNPAQPTNPAGAPLPTILQILATATNAAAATSAAALKTAPASPGGSIPTQTAQAAPPLPTPDGAPVVELRVGIPQPAPQGILPLVGILEAGGGGGYGAVQCEAAAGQIRWCTSFHGSALLLTETYTAVACGFGSGELGAVVQLPDGRSQAASVAGDAAGCREVSYLPGPGAPLGNYQITLSQGAAQLTDRFQLSLPAGPTGALYDQCAWLAGWPAGQPVRLLAFGLAAPTPDDPAPDSGLAFWRFLSETRPTPGAGGALLICPDAAGLARYPEFVYLAYPTGSGAAAVLLGDGDLLQQFQGVCGSGPATRLSPGMKARVQSKNLPLFNDPGMNGKPLTTLNQGAQISVLAGPVCPPQGPWIWQVKTADALTGWLAEADQTTYFLEPQR